MKPSIGADRLFLDTWGWLALADALDPAHPGAIAERRMRTPGNLVTSDYILDETFTRLFSRCRFNVAQKFSKGIFEAESEGLLKLERVTPERFEAAYQLRLRFRDKPGISFTDLTSFVVMRELGITDVLTADAHFVQ